MKKTNQKKKWPEIIKEHEKIWFFLEGEHGDDCIEYRKDYVYTIGDSVKIIDDGYSRIDHFLAAFTDYTKDEDVFRGFQKPEELYPGYKRRNREVNELSALRLFEKQGSAYFKASNPLEFIANAQHYGLPTRLIDFTRNPYIALFFSMYRKLNDNDNQNYYYIIMAKYKDNLILDELPVFDSDYFIENEEGVTVYKGPGNEYQHYNYYKKIEEINKELYEFYCEEAIDENNQKMMASFMNEAREVDNNYKPIGLSAEESRKKQSVLFVEPNLTNDRIKNQQGLFMYPYIDDENKHNEILKNNTRILAIHKSYRDMVLKHLEMIGITEYQLMPDLASICNEIVRELRENGVHN